MAGGLCRRCHDCSQLSGLFEKVGDGCATGEAAAEHEFKPEDRFVGLLSDDAHPRIELGARPRTTASPVVRRNRRRRANQLAEYRPALSKVGKVLHEPHHVQREVPRPVLQFLGFHHTASSRIRKSTNQQLNKSTNDAIVLSLIDCPISGNVASTCRSSSSVSP